MGTLHDYIRRLYLEKLTQTISVEDAVALQGLLRDNDEAQLIWAELERERSDLDADIVLSGIDPEQELKKWREHTGMGGMGNKPVVRSGWWKWVAAASFIGIVVLGWWSDRGFKQVAAPQAAADKPEEIKTADVKLVLADGKTVNFSRDQSQEYTVEGVALEHSGTRLAYKNAGVKSTALNTLEIPAKADYSITLSDGTRVFLNSKSKLSFPFYFGDKQREIFIEGEAYLEVSKDAKRPFIVHTPLTDIRVLGTKFNVNTYEEGIVRTSLVEGSVLLKDADKDSITLRPGREALYRDNKGFTAHNFDAAEVLSWRDGIFYFQRQSLEDISAVVSRWFGVHMVFEQDALSNHTVSGLLEKGRLEDFLENLYKTAGIDHSLNDTVLVLKKR